MKFFFRKQPPAESPTSEERPHTPEEIIGQGESVDVLYDFFDFVDATAGDLHAYVLYRCGEPALARDIVGQVYEIVLKRWRLYRLRKSATLPMLFALADKGIASLPKTVPIKDVPPEERREEVFKPLRNLFSSGEKVALRMSLLERYKERRRLAVRLLLQTAVFLIAVPGMGLFLVQPQPMGKTLQQLSAVEILLIGQEQAPIVALAETESHLRGLASHHAGEEVAAIVVELASLALRDQVRDRQSVNGILRQFGAQTVAARLRAPRIAHCIAGC